MEGKARHGDVFKLLVFNQQSKIQTYRESRCVGAWLASLLQKALLVGVCVRVKCQEVAHMAPQHLLRAVRRR